MVVKTGGIAGCCTRNRSSVGASGNMWDRDNVGATDMGSTRSRYDGDMRAKCEGGMAMDDRARGAGGVVVDRSVGAQRACSSEGGIWTWMGDMAGIM